MMAGKNGTSAFDMILAFDLAFSNRVRSVGDIAVGQYSVKWSQFTMNYKRRQKCKTLVHLR